MSDAPERIWLVHDIGGTVWAAESDSPGCPEPPDIVGEYIRADLVEQDKAAIKDRLEEAFEAALEGKHVADDLDEILAILNGEASDDG